MKFIDLNDDYSVSQTLVPVSHPIIQPKLPILSAKWEIVEGKLVCRWVVE